MYSFYLCIAINNQKCLTNHKTMMTIVNKLKVLALLLMLGQGCVCMAQNQKMDNLMECSMFRK